jgi:hypothetical protein
MQHQEPASAWESTAFKHSKQLGQKMYGNLKPEKKAVSKIKKHLTPQKTDEFLIKYNMKMP